MFKGIVLALVLMMTSDLALNRGELTYAAWTKFHHFMSASSGAVHNSLWSW